MKIYTVRMSAESLIDLLTPGKIKPFIVSEGLPENVSLFRVDMDKDYTVLLRFIGHSRSFGITEESINIIMEKVGE